MAITLMQICNAIETSVATMSTSPRTSSYDELIEAVQEHPYAEVYWERTNLVDTRSGQGQTARGTFGGDLIEEQHIFHVDYYARHRSHIDEDMDAVTQGADALINVLEAEDCEPFNLTGIRSFQWEIMRTVFERGAGENAVKHVGFRCVITVTTY